MKKYYAVGRGFWNERVEDVDFEAENDNDAYHYIINHYNCSLNWTFEEVVQCAKD